MNKQLTIGDILKMIEDMKNHGMNMEDIKALPVYVGNDDELNEIHCAWYFSLVTNNKEDTNSKYYREMINERWGNNKLDDNKQAILIS